MSTKPPKELLSFLRPYSRTFCKLAIGLRKIVIDELGPCYESIYDAYNIIPLSEDRLNQEAGQTAGAGSLKSNVLAQAAALSSTIAYDWLDHSSSYDDSRSCYGANDEPAAHRKATAMFLHLVHLRIRDGLRAACLGISQRERVLLRSTDIAFQFCFVAKFDFDAGITTNSEFLHRGPSFCGLLNVRRCLWRESKQEGLPP